MVSGLSHYRWAEELGQVMLHELTGDIEVAQKALGHAHRSTTEDIYDHAEKIVDVKTTGMLLDWLLGTEQELLHQSDVIN
jgi:integrase